MHKKEGSIIGGVLLIAGSCIGAGMLGLPVITSLAGFVPSVLMFIVAWLFMVATSLLLLEANVSVGHHLSLISISEKILGRAGKWICWFFFLFLFYCLGVAYVVASGSILQTILADLTGYTLSPWVGSLLFSLVFSFILYIGTRPVDYLNRLFMIGLIASYSLLIMLGSQHIHLSYLQSSNWKYALTGIPILIISFGFHNMIPSLAMYFRGDIPRLRLTIILGSLLPLLVYLLWELVILGIIPIQGREGLIHALNQGEIATTALRKVVGLSWINTLGQAFALFAIVTSFLTQSLSLVDFLADGWKIKKTGASRLFLILATLVPPLACAFFFPGIFLKALGFAGGFAAVILFGLLPTWMVWILRYQRKEVRTEILPGGKPVLLLILICAVTIFTLQVVQEANKHVPFSKKTGFSR